MTLRAVIELISRLIDLLQAANSQLLKIKEDRELKRHTDNNKTASDPTKSLEDRAKALCEIEKDFNPNSDCDDKRLRDGTGS